ncbi:PIN/TRAM domain-containing protein [Phycisphaerales bacterium AB-hyl4]|uniref:PIN/TRAM domain-containing protein n=1 Tax=Natronomicrosphaera hydrolytica TaxID=3242702 RepID=A0ABV4U0E7_9BACT
MVLSILRGAFILLVASVAALYVVSWQREMAAQDEQISLFTVVLMLGITLGIAGVIIAIDAGTRRKRLSAVSGIFLGLIAGLLAAYALSFPVGLVAVLFAPAPGEAGFEEFMNLLQGVQVIIGLITCYIGISLVIQTKDDFRFVIPYVEFAKQIRGNRPTILDTSVIVDGRVLDIIETHVLQGLVVVPKFVLNELQTIADSSDKLRRARGRRGLEVLQKLQDSPAVEISIEEATDVDGVNVDQKLIGLAQHMQGRVMTNDYNLNKVATLRGVEVINLNDLAKAMRPVVLPGEHMDIRVVKPGEGPTQGVGYLDDGTMVVVEGARNHIGEAVSLIVTSTLQTSAGRMIFGRYETSQDSGTATPPAEADAAEPGDAPPAEPAGAGAGSSRPRAARPRTGRNPRRGG